MPQDYSKSPLHAQQRHRAYKTTMGSSVSGIPNPSDLTGVDTGAGCNILPTHKAQQLFSQEWLETLNPPKVQIEAYIGHSVHILG